MSLDPAAAAELRDAAFDAAPPSSGAIQHQSLDGQTHTTEFEWIADADPRLGPLLEVLVGGKYYWVPWLRIRAVRIEPPADLRDAAWIPARFLWSTGADQDGFIPARYSGSESPAHSGPIRLARSTEWTTSPSGLDLPIGQRLLATSAGEFSLFETRSIRIGPEPVEWPSDRMSAGVAPVAQIPGDANA
jgi:type VI secretion system protein ImpE